MNEKHRNNKKIYITMLFDIFLFPNCSPFPNFFISIFFNEL